MGTNYYLHTKPDCECCGRPFEPLHIGKSSGGWCFSLHVMPEDGINDLDDWLSLMAKPGAFVRNEYGEKVSREELLATITERKWGGGTFDGREWTNSWYANEASFHDSNNSERGPNGLLRHRISRHCIKHGDGTWDCITGEFS